MIKKPIVFPDGTEANYHVVHSFVFGEDGGCVAKVSSYVDMFDACTMRNRAHIMPLRCDGVSPTENTLAQIYGVLANDPLFSGAEALSSEAEQGTANPFVVLSEKPERPSKWHEWNSAAWSWVLVAGALEAAKQEARTRINLARDEAERSGFPAYGKVFDSDEKSIKRILSASQAAAAAKSLGMVVSEEWACADNSTINLDTDMLIALPMHMTAAGSAIHMRARALKSQIEAAGSIPEIEAIVW